VRILALDIGEKRIGLAVSDALNITAQGLETLRRTSAEDTLKKIRALIKEYDVSKIVIGMPFNMDGTEGPSARAAGEFAAILRKDTGVTVEMVDERLTSAQGERMLLEADISRKKRKRAIDKIAAQLILQTYLESHVQKDSSR